MRKPTTKLLQGTLGFSSRLSQVSTLKSLTLVSLQASSPRPTSLSPTLQSQSQQSSLAATRSEKKKKAGTIASIRRTHFEIDFDYEDLLLYKLRPRGPRAISQNRISWIYLHGMELKRKKDHAKHWLYKHCYKGSPPKVKVIASESTSSCTNHLGSEHCIYQPGKESAPANTAAIMNTCLKDVAPLAAERWREHFIN
jgi:hypothetical protein